MSHIKLIKVSILHILGKKCNTFGFYNLIVIFDEK
jgi:hypothetical protein